MEGWAVDQQHAGVALRRVGLFGEGPTSVPEPSVVARQQLLPLARQNHAAARGRSLHMVAHIGARLVAAWIARDENLDHLGLDDDIDQALGIC